MTNAEKIREFLKTGAHSLGEIAAHTKLSTVAANSYLYLDLKKGVVVRSGSRCKYRYALSGGKGQDSQPASDRDSGSESAGGRAGPAAQGEEGASA